MGYREDLIFAGILIDVGHLKGGVERGCIYLYVINIKLSAKCS